MYKRQIVQSGLMDASVASLGGGLPLIIPLIMKLGKSGSGRKMIKIRKIKIRIRMGRIVRIRWIPAVVPEQLLKQ